MTPSISAIIRRSAMVSVNLPHIAYQSFCREPNLTPARLSYERAEDHAPERLINHTRVSRFADGLKIRGSTRVEF
jgi:hypothetical protein